MYIFADLLCVAKKVEPGYFFLREIVVISPLSVCVCVSDVSSTAFDWVVGQNDDDNDVEWNCDSGKCNKNERVILAIELRRYAFGWLDGREIDFQNHCIDGGGMVGRWKENNLFLWSFNFSCGINQFSGLLMTELMVNGMTNGWDCGATGRGENLLWLRFTNYNLSTNIKFRDQKKSIKNQ